MSEESFTQLSRSLGTFLSEMNAQDQDAASRNTCTLPINNNSLFFSDATVDIAMPIPCTASSHAISVKAFRWRI